jgi:sulfur carrier protein
VGAGDLAHRHYNSAMHLRINGESRQVPDSLDVAGLVELLGMKSDRVAVELNREIVPRAEWQGRALREGDDLEVVHFVGGG